MKLNEMMNVVREIHDCYRSGNVVLASVLMAGLSAYGWKRELDTDEYDYVFNNHIRRYGFRFERGDLIVRCF